MTRFSKRTGMRRLALALTLCGALGGLSAQGAAADVFFATDFESKPDGLADVLGYGAVEVAASDRITTPREAARTGTAGMRVDIHPGDTAGANDGRPRNRAEIALTNLPAPGVLSARPFPADLVGTTRWIAQDLYFPSATHGGAAGEQGFPNYQRPGTTKLERYHLLYQSGVPGQSPPFALSVIDDRIGLMAATVVAENPLKTTFSWPWESAPIVRDRWYRVIIGVHYSGYPDNGWVQVWMDDGSGAGMKLVLPQTHMRTTAWKKGDQHTVQSGSQVPGYDKFGSYRHVDTSIHQVHYVDRIRVASTLEETTLKLDGGVLPPNQVPNSILSSLGSSKGQRTSPDAPRLYAFTVHPKRITYRKAGTPLIELLARNTRGRRGAATLKWAASKRSLAVILVERQYRGTRRENRCVERGRRSGRARRSRCVGHEVVNLLYRLATPGRKTVALNGRIGEQVLRPGLYRLSMALVDLNGERSGIRRLYVRVIRR